jgi:hypothetical protein
MDILRITIKLIFADEEDVPVTTLIPANRDRHVDFDS